MKKDLSSYTIQQLKELAYWQPSSGFGLVDYNAEIQKRLDPKNYESSKIHLSSRNFGT
jgi:hypothetical protein